VRPLEVARALQGVFSALLVLVSFQGVRGARERPLRFGGGGALPFFGGGGAFLFAGGGPGGGGACFFGGGGGAPPFLGGGGGGADFSAMIFLLWQSR